jgi:UDP-N-acetylmuramoyl-tripeptide--D-alanyl-D-alanine ligase
VFTRDEILRKGISTDSRTVKPGELFIPLVGKKFDGRKFIPEALRKGALVLKTENGLKALQDLAAYHRSKFKLPVIGVTGSCGKTTTKDMIESILSREKATLKNEENFNNEIGVPLTLLKLTKKHKAAVIEMAMQRPGEIEELAAIVRPTIAVVTNIGEAHLEFLETKRNVASAKSEIFKFLRRENFAVINQDDEHFEHLKSKVKSQKSKIMTFGIIEKANVTPKDLAGIKLPIPGEHNIYNALAAIAVAKILKLKRRSIKRGLEKFRPSSKRMELINRSDGVKIINDTYNANPQSMSAALRTLAIMKGRKIAVMGDMLELGKAAGAAHRRVLKLSRDLKIDKVYTFGKLWPKAFKGKKRLIKNLKKIIRPRDIILVKGSRGMQMEEVVEALR